MHCGFGSRGRGRFDDPVAGGMRRFLSLCAAVAGMPVFSGVRCPETAEAVNMTLRNNFLVHESAGFADALFQSVGFFGGRRYQFPIARIVSFKVFFCVAAVHGTFMPMHTAAEAPFFAELMFMAISQDRNFGTFFNKVVAKDANQISGVSFGRCGRSTFIHSSSDMRGYLDGVFANLADVPMAGFVANQTGFVRLVGKLKGCAAFFAGKAMGQIVDFLPFNIAVEMCAGFNLLTACAGTGAGVNSS